MDALDAAGIAHQRAGDGTLFGVVFADSSVQNYRDMQGADMATYSRYNAALSIKEIIKSTGDLYPSLALTGVDLAQTETAAE